MATFNLADLFELVVDTVPADREALICGDSRHTFKEIDQRANQLAHFMHAQGIEPGNHVGLYMYNCGEYLEAMWACFKIRAVPVNVNYRYVNEELLYLFDNANLAACVHGREFVPAIEQVRQSVPDLKLFISVEDGSTEDLNAIGAIEYEQALAGSSTERDFEPRKEDDLFILYTGGTTGMPKGVMWPHKALFYAAMNGAGHFHADGPCKVPEDIISRAKDNWFMKSMALAPLMHGACWWSAMISALAGHTIVLNSNKSFDAEEIWDIIEREEVNAVSFVGDAMGIPLMDALEANEGRWDLKALFSAGSGGAVFSNSLQDKFRAKFPNIMLMNSFGSSESGQMGADGGGGSDGLGKVQQSEFMNVVVEATEDTPAHFAEPGSDQMGIFARSGHIPLGYYGDPEKTAKTFIQVEGQRWLLTGDEAKIDIEGGITVYGRGSNCINTGGEKVFPEEVEQAIKSHPAVFDTLVVATPDERFTNKVTAVAQLREGCTLALDELQEHCRQHISGYKLPRELHLTQEIGRAPSGKPNYKWAKEIALGQEFLAS
ncbi:MAG: acyl-CoA synthetase [Pseudomonadales bacterium]